jgi:hypothetical protein
MRAGQAHRSPGISGRHSVDLPKPNARLHRHGVFTDGRTLLLPAEEGNTFP